MAIPAFWGRMTVDVLFSPGYQPLMWIFCGFLAKIIAISAV
jgi:hypothetical protein